MMNWNWPDNKRIALLLSFDIDAETLWLTRNDINERHLVHMSAVFMLRSRACRAS